jgi:hypothetical protein
MLWHALMAMSEEAMQCGGTIPVAGRLARGFADLRDSMPLHGAAKKGRLDIVEWLVQRGAARSLQMKTAPGATPMMCSRGACRAL